jgi:hypothetical protein
MPPPLSRSVKITGGSPLTPLDASRPPRKAPGRSSLAADFTTPLPKTRLTQTQAPIEASSSEEPLYRTPIPALALPHADRSESVENDPNEGDYPSRTDDAMDRGYALSAMGDLRIAYNRPTDDSPSLFQLATLLASKAQLDQRDIVDRGVHAYDSRPRFILKPDLERRATFVVEGLQELLQDVAELVQSRTGP